MNNRGMAALAAELQATKSALQATRQELEAAKNQHDSPGLSGRTSASAPTETRARESIGGRYLLLLVIGLLAAWQVYVTVQLNALIQ